MRSIFMRTSFVLTALAVLLASWCCGASACLVPTDSHAANVSPVHVVGSCPLCYAGDSHRSNPQSDRTCPLRRAGFVLASSVDHHFTIHLALLTPLLVSPIDSTHQPSIHLPPSSDLVPFSPAPTLFQLHCALTI
jgi:hypothetical protein